MAFTKKEWTDRVAEYINRRVLNKTDGTQEVVTVERSEGDVSVEGDAFNAANMNDLEDRIEAAFSGIELTAEKVEYDDTSTSLGSTTVQDAIEKLDSRLDETDTSISSINSDLNQLVKKVGNGMRVVKYGTTTGGTIQLGETIDISKYIVLLDTKAYTKSWSTKSETYMESSHAGAYGYGYGYGYAYGYGDGAYLSAKTNTSFTITCSEGITCSYQVVALS